MKKIRSGNMRVIPLARREYLKALGHVHPLDRYDRFKRMADIVGRAAARKLRNDPEFLGHLRSYNMGRAGQRFHRVAELLARKLAARSKVAKRMGLASEKRITSTLNQKYIKVDLFARLVRKLYENDWKYSGKSAVKPANQGQMRRHARIIRENFPVRKLVQIARNWSDYVRQAGGEAAKSLPKGRPKLPKSRVTTLDDLRRHPELDRPIRADKYKGRPTNPPQAKLDASAKARADKKAKSGAK